MSWWSLFQRSVGPAWVLGSLSMVVLWPGATDPLFLGASGTAVMMVFAHRNGHFLPRRPVLAWAIVLGVAPLPFVGVMRLMVTGGRPLSDPSIVRIGVLWLWIFALAAVIAFLRQRGGDESRLAKVLKTVDPPEEALWPKRRR